MEPSVQEAALAEQVFDLEISSLSLSSNGHFELTSRDMRSDGQDFKPAWSSNCLFSHSDQDVISRGGMLDLQQGWACSVGVRRTCSKAVKQANRGKEQLMRQGRLKDPCYKPGLVGHPWNPSTQKAEARLLLQEQAGPCREPLPQITKPNNPPKNKLISKSQECVLYQPHQEEAGPPWCVLEHCGPDGEARGTATLRP